MQSLMATYMEQSKAMFKQMQDQLQNQTRSMLSAFPFPGLAGQAAPKAEPEPDEGKPASKG
jgi:polyhydroxyalkanoate synthesis regulator protein